MYSEKYSIRRIKSSQIQAAGYDIAEAFINDSLMKYFIPDFEKRSEYLPKYFQFMLKLCNKYGYVYTTDPDHKGFALWLPSEISLNVSWIQLINSGWFNLHYSLGREIVTRINEYNSYIDRPHKKNMPESHCYLDLIAVHPQYQKEGRATAMIIEVLKNLDEKQMPCYLVTQNDENVSLYSKLGFNVIDKTKIPGTNINHWEMKRGSNYLEKGII